MPPRNVPAVLEIFGKRFLIWEDIDNKFLRACLAEFLAMHLFVLLCCGCAMVTLNLSNPNLMMVAASFGFGILVLAQIFGPLSGAHINSAVSLGLFVAGRTTFIRTFCYTLSQMLGSIFGALFLWAIFGDNWPAARAFGSNSWDESVFNGGQVFFAECLGTALLMFNVLSTIDIPTEGGGPLGVYPIAMSVMVAHLFLLPIDGCSINPTRSFGPSLVAQWANIPGTYYHQQSMFWFAPMFGACVAAYVYEYGSLKPENFAGAKDMDTALFQAGKRKKKRHSKHPDAKTGVSTNDQVGSNDSYPPHEEVENVLITNAGSSLATSSLPPPPLAPNRSATPPAPQAASPVQLNPTAPASSKAPPSVPTPSKSGRPLPAVPSRPAPAPAPAPAPPAIPTGFEEDLEDQDLL